jgi:hypothetical protein
VRTSWWTPHAHIRGGVAFPTRPTTKTYLRSSDVPRAGLGEGEWFEPGAFGRCGQAWTLLFPVDWSLLFVVATGCAFKSARSVLILIGWSQLPSRPQKLPDSFRSTIGSFVSSILFSSSGTSALSTNQTRIRFHPLYRLDRIKSFLSFIYLLPRQRSNGATSRSSSYVTTSQELYIK